MMAMMKIRPESREEIPVNVLSKHPDILLTNFKIKAIQIIFYVSTVK